jgi:hypothetical protein
MLYASGNRIFACEESVSQGTAERVACNLKETEIETGIEIGLELMI